MDFNYLFFSQCREIIENANIFLRFMKWIQHHNSNFWADSRLATNQWETLLLSNAVSHWLHANLDSAQLFMFSALQAIMEEADLRSAEIKKASYEFERDVLKGAVNQRTGKVIAEKCTRYFDDKLRARVGSCSFPWFWIQYIGVKTIIIFIQISQKFVCSDPVYNKLFLQVMTWCQNGFK